MQGCDVSSCCCITQMDITVNGKILTGNGKVTGQCSSSTSTVTGAADLPSNNVLSMSLSNGLWMSGRFSDSGTFTGVNNQT